ncbi:MAG: M17 family peptidase N-terminal domain-containing protein, partial [Leptolyngbyaceae cyanobacterium bins.59]|nr:M17 family peptidase N-terminal domain-containing protein [Leptolyngbyaceae cyanobacterium bins.59]
MDLKVTEAQRLDWAGDGLVIGLFEGAVELTGDLQELDGKLSGTLVDLISDTEFKGKEGSSAVTRVGGSSIRKLILVGLGKPETLKLDTLRRAAAQGGRLGRKEKCQTLGVSFPIWQDNSPMTAQAIAEGLILGLHQDNRFKSEPDEKTRFPESVQILGLAGQETALRQAEQICAGVILARELVAAPPNVVNPLTMADTALKIAQDHGLEVEILEGEECERLGMGAFLGVARASDLPPKFIHLTYKPEGTPRRKLAIVGKENVGKSVLCRRLMRDDGGARKLLASRSPTAGIQQRTWLNPLGVADGDEALLKLIVWDYAGQHAYRGTHQCFFTRQAVYLLVFDLSDDAEASSTDVLQWIADIQARTSGAVFGLVGNKADLVTPEDALERYCLVLDAAQDYVHRRRQRTCGRSSVVVPEPRDEGVSCWMVGCTDEHIGLHNCIDRLREALVCRLIMQQRDAFPHLFQERPAVYRSVLDRLHTLSAVTKRLFVTVEDLQASAQVDADELKNALQFWHDVGLCLWYREVPSL